MLHFFRMAIFACFLLFLQPDVRGEENGTTELVADFKGVQITGVTVSDDGRVFANAPNWRDGVPFAVIEVIDGKAKPFPDLAFNTCVSSGRVRNDCFLAVQSVVAHANKLYVLDTRNPKFGGVKDAPRIFVFDLTTNHRLPDLVLSDDAFFADSYINDLRVDTDRNRIYMTDSNHPGLVVLETKTGESYRILNEHKSTTAEFDKLTIDGKPWNNTVHADGIAFDRNSGTLYYHALTGYTLYALDVNLIQKGKDLGDSVQTVATTAAPDGMIIDKRGNLYFADLENHKIQYIAKSLDIRTLVEGSDVRWADTFSIHENWLYYTNSRIHEAGDDVSDLIFDIRRVRLPN